jgi:predicted extracellular nuclease/endonuclease I
MKFKYPALLALFCAPIAQASDLIITGAFDGPLTGGVPKGIEVYVANDIADLSRCGVGSANNGLGTDGEEFTFPAVAASAGSYLYIASEAPNFTAFFGFPPTYTSGAMAINGDDAIELFCDSVVVDVFGDINVDGTGQPWDYLDGWANRAPGTGADGSTFILANWIFSGINALEGGDTNDTVTSPFPYTAYAGGEPGGGDTGGGTDPTTPCFNCPELEKIADAGLFDDGSYYASAITEVAASSSASIIKNAINQIISTDHRDLTYSEVWTALTHTDEDPGNTNNVILWYTGRSMAKSSNGSGSQSSDPDNWNREHSWPQSHGFADLEESAEAYTDIHHLRPTDISVNQDRGNLDFDNSDTVYPDAPDTRIDDDSFEPRNQVKGDVARMMFYMDTRYEGSGNDTTADLQLVDSLTSIGTTELGRLCRLIEWHNGDPVDATEQLRNNTIYEYQGNRNPYIDHPEWVSILYQTEACAGGPGGGDTGGGGDTNAPINLFISEYIEGSSNNKAIEIYNNSAQSVDLTTANVVLARFSNGGTSPSNISLTGTIAAFGTYVIANTSANDQIKAFADQLSGSVSHNGDDAYTLLVDGVVIDSFGQVGTDPGSSWGTDTFSTANNTLRRNPSVISGDTVVDDAFEPSLEWTGFGIDVADGLGQHAVDLGEIFISEYIEGSSNNKALEFYNPNSVAIDLTPYSLLRSTNGGSSEATIDLVGTIAPYGVFVIANNSSAQAILDVADQLTSAINHNGDDAYVLYKDGAAIDSFGQVGVDPGSQWGAGDVGTANHTLVRKLSVKQGDTIIDDAFDPATEWDGFAQDTFEFLGSYGDGGGDTGGETVLLGQCADPATLISAVQGNTDVSPLLGETHVIEGVVTGSFASLSGYFVQEESADEDADSATSEGIFVFSPSLPLPQVGKIVRVKGDVAEFFDKTQLAVTELRSDCGEASIYATMFYLPFASAESAEALEGMLVSNGNELTVTDNYSLGRYGEVKLSNGRLFIPTNLFPAGSPEAIDLAAQNALNQITLDDGQNGQNPELVVYPTGGLSAANTLRGGDTVSAVTGVMDYSFNLYRIVPVQAPTFVASNPRTDAPDLALGNLKVASLNVLNYFTTLDLPGVSPDPRGADSAEELVRQRAKTLAAIVALDADILGLMEIENNGVTGALGDLVNGLNDILGAGTYAAVDAGTPGTDQIAVAFIYKPAVVSTSGTLAILDSSNSIADENGPLFVDTKNRPSLNQKFALAANGEEIVISVNHLKSKGSGCGAGDDDTTTGQGSCNLTRTRAAQALTAFLAEQFGDTPTLIIGDLNSYAMEDPILKIQQAGYINLAHKFKGDEAYSYAFGGEYGYLDHALANPSLVDKVVDTTEWHINADEPIALDYNVEYKSAQQVVDFYAPDAYRMSDHDPVVISILLEPEAVLGDWDGDGDVDMNDITGLYKAVLSRLPIDMVFDLNNDGVVNAVDVRVQRNMCTRARCATN